MRRLNTLLPCLAGLILVGSTQAADGKKLIIDVFAVEKVEGQKDYLIEDSTYIIEDGASITLDRTNKAYASANDKSKTIPVGRFIQITPRLQPNGSLQAGVKIRQNHHLGYRDDGSINLEEYYDQEAIVKLNLHQAAVVGAWSYNRRLDVAIVGSVYDPAVESSKTGGRGNPVQKINDPRPTLIRRRIIRRRSVPWYLFSNSLEAGDNSSK